MLNSAQHKIASEKLEHSRKVLDDYLRLAKRHRFHGRNTFAKSYDRSFDRELDFAAGMRSMLNALNEIEGV